jgi:hypothetical protein
MGCGALLDVYVISKKCAAFILIVDSHAKIFFYPADRGNKFL